MLVLITPIIVVLVVSGILYNYYHFHITGTSQFTTDSSFLNINFNKPIKLSSINVSSTPNLVFNYDLYDQKTIRIELSATPTANTTYTFYVSAVSTNNQAIKNTGIKLTSKVLDFSKLSASQQKALVNSQDNTIKTATNKIFTVLPYYSTYYYLVAQANGTNNPNIIFTYLPPPSFEPALIQAEEPSKQALIAQAETWLTQQGIDLSNYQLLDSVTGQQLN